MSGPLHPRGTSNSNDRGSAETRRIRRRWLLSPDAGFGGDGTTVPCYRAKTHCNQQALTAETMQIDRKIPGIFGGGYGRDNIRPSCADCNRATGHLLREAIRRDRVAEVFPELAGLPLLPRKATA